MYWENRESEVSRVWMDLTVVREPKVSRVTRAAKDRQERRDQSVCPVAKVYSVITERVGRKENSARKGLKVMRVRREMPVRMD